MGGRRGLVGLCIALGLIAPAAASAQAPKSGTSVCALVTCQRVDVDGTAIAQLADTADSLCTVLGGERPDPSQPLGVCIRHPDSGSGPTRYTALFLINGVVGTFERSGNGPCGEHVARGFIVYGVQVFSERGYC